MSFLIFIMPPDSRMFHSKYFFSVWFGRFLGSGGERAGWGELICDNWECLDLSAQDSIVIYAKFLSLAQWLNQRQCLTEI